MHSTFKVDQSKHDTWGFALIQLWNNAWCVSSKGGLWPLSLSWGFTQPTKCVNPLGVNSEEAANRKGAVMTARKTPRASTGHIDTWHTKGKQVMPGRRADLPSLTSYNQTVNINSQSEPESSVFTDAFHWRYSQLPRLFVYCEWWLGVSMPHR